MYLIKIMETGQLSEYGFDNVNDAHYYINMMAKVDCLDGKKLTRRVVYVSSDIKELA